MPEQTHENRDQRPTHKLGSGLRRAVEDLLGESPPDDLLQQTLEGLRQRRPHVARRVTPRLLLLGALAAAAGIAVSVWLGQDHHGGNGEQRPAPPQPVAVRPADQLPTLWAYHRASLESPEALERLLDKHAARLLVSDSEPLRMWTFPGLAEQTL